MSVVQAVSVVQNEVTLAGVAVAGGTAGFGDLHTLNLAVTHPVPAVNSFATTQASGEEPDAHQVS